MHERSVVTLRDRLILYLYEHRVWGVELSELISGIGEKNVVDELSRLLEEGIIEEVGGKYILTISGIKEAEKIVEKIKEIKVIVKEKEELKEVRVAEQVVGKFVGRKKELEILKKLVDLAIEGKGGMVFVTGEAGLGRTRLINEAKEYAVSRGMVPMLGRCLYSEGMDPYLPIIEMLKNYMLAEKKEEVPIGLIPIHMPQLISPIKKKEDDFQLERSRMFDSIVKMIVDTAEEKPVFLFLDDIHWADKGTLRLLHYIANATKNTGVLICCAYRPEELVDKGAQDIIMRMGREGLFVTVELKKLSKEETKEMVSSLIKVGEIPDELIEKIYRDTEGNPLFIEETIKTLVSEGIISYEAGGIVIKERETALPERIRDVLLRRINMLEPTVMKIIGFASVIGTEFSIEVLKN
ncbi:MAG: AAA family ATPase, partial [Candidatus Thermoplasmatota archaeon]